MAVLRLERVWGWGGQAACRPGDQVEPETVVGYGPTPPPQTVLLEADRGQTVATLLHRKGDRVSRGEPLAFYSFMFGLGYREFVSPVDGEVVGLEPGRILVQPFPAPVRALVSGRVEEVREDRAIISTEGLLLPGRLAWGPARGGELVPLPNGELLPDQVGDAHTGRVVAGGWAGREALESAFAVGVAALVLGGVAQAAVEWLTGMRASLSPDEYLARVYAGPRGTAGEPLWKAEDGLPLTLVVMNGFGALPLVADCHAALAGAAGGWCYVSGEEVSPPQVVVAAKVTTAGGVVTQGGPAVPGGPRAPGSVVAGARVRLTGMRRAGEEGTVVEVLPEPILLPTEVAVPAARVKLADGSLAVVPLSNLEPLPG